MRSTGHALRGIRSLGCTTREGLVGSHRVAIANARITAIENGTVSFRCRDRKRTGRSRTVTLSIDEFIRRFLLHVLPAGFVRIRHFGFLANSIKARSLTTCRVLLGVEPEVEAGVSMTAAERMTALTGINVKRCPCCQRGRMGWVAEIPPARSSAQTRASPSRIASATS